MVASDEEQRAQREAADWFGRLRSRSVTTDELTEFAIWRREAANRRAYARMEALWDDSAAVRNDPEIGDALRTALRRRGLRRWVGRLVTDRVTLTLAASLAAVAVVLLIVPIFNPWAGQGYRTGVGESSVIQLGDGTRVRLDTSSTMTARSEGGGRRVDVAGGQAYFDVRHDPRHPFVVDLGDGTTVTDVGTRFDVRRSGNTAAVTLYEGSVIVANGGSSVRLSPGQSVGVTAGVIGPVSGGTGTGQPLWVTGRLSFKDTPLDVAVSEVNRYSPRRLTVAKTAYAHQPVNGDFSTDDPDGFVAAANALFGSGVVVREPDA